MAKIVKIKNNFSTIPNTWLRDKNISLKAKGLIATMQSLPDDWDFTISGLASIMKEGRDSVRSALLELKKAGYVSWTQNNTEGKFGENIVELHEKPMTGTPLSENPTTDIPTQYNKDKLKKDETNKDITLTTKVVKGASAELTTYGNSEINEMFDKWNEMFGYRQKDSKANRYACANMLKSKDKGKEWLLNTMKMMRESLKDRYAGKLVNGNAGFADIQKNYAQIWLWGRKKWESQQEPNEIDLGGIK